MARIHINDLPTLDHLTPEQLKELFGAGPFKPGMEALEDRVLLASRLGLGDIAQAAARPSNDAEQVSTVEPSTNAGTVQVDVAVDPRDIENLDQAMPQQHDALNGVTDGMTGTDSPTADRGEVESPEGLSHEIVLDPQEAPHDIQPWEQTEYNEAFDARGPQNPGDYAGNMSDLALGGRIEKAGIDAGAMDGSIFGVDISDDGSPRDVTPDDMAGQTDGKHKGKLDQVYEIINSDDSAKDKYDAMSELADETFAATPAGQKQASESMGQLPSSESSPVDQPSSSQWEKDKREKLNVLGNSKLLKSGKLGHATPTTKSTTNAPTDPGSAKHSNTKKPDEKAEKQPEKQETKINEDRGPDYTGPGSIEGFETEYAIKIHSKLNDDINWGDQVGGSKSDAGERYSGDVGEGGATVGIGGDDSGGILTDAIKGGPVPNVEQSPLKTDQIDYGEGGKPHVGQPNEQVIKNAKDTGDIDYGDGK